MKLSKEQHLKLYSILIKEGFKHIEFYYGEELLKVFFGFPFTDEWMEVEDFISETESKGSLKESAIVWNNYHSANYNLRKFRWLWVECEKVNQIIKQLKEE